MIPMSYHLRERIDATVPFFLVYEISAQTYIFNFISMASCSAIVGVSRSQGSVKSMSSGREDSNTMSTQYFMLFCRDCHDYGCVGGQLGCVGGQLGYVSAAGDDMSKGSNTGDSQSAAVPPDPDPLTLMVAVRQCLKSVALARAERDTDHRDNPRTRSLRPC